MGEEEHPARVAFGFSLGPGGSGGGRQGAQKPAAAAAPAGAAARAFLGAAAAARAESDGDVKELVTGFSGGVLQSAEGAKPKKQPKIIKALPNTWDPATELQQKYAEAEAAAAAAVGETAGGAEGAVAAAKKAADRFEVAQADEVAQAPDVKYGLNNMRERMEQRKKAEQQQPQQPQPQQQESGNDQQQHFSGDPAAAAQPSRPSFGGRAPRGGKDAEDLPEVATLAQYEAMPVEDFGLAMLRGMGWKKGMAVGRSGKGPAAPVEYLKRPDKLGLGADPNTLASLREATGQAKKKRFIKPGEKRGPAEMMVAEGTMRSVRRLDEKLTKAPVRGAAVGKTMEVVAGPHSGLTCEVNEVVKEEGRSDRALVTLVGSGATVRVRCSELGEIGEAAKREEARAEAEAAAEAAAADARAKAVAAEAEALPRAKAFAAADCDAVRVKVEEMSDADAPVLPSEGPAEQGSARVEARGRDRDESMDGGRRDRGGDRDHDRHDGRDRDRDRDRYRDRDKDRDRERSRHKREHKRDREHRERERGHKRHKSDRDDRHRRDRSQRDHAPPPPPPRDAAWLRPGIVVRVVSKRLAEGKLYLQKGYVLDVTGPEEATLSMLSGNGDTVVHEVPQRSLETALPKRGGRVIVVKGEHRGEVAQLIERHSDSGEATVQLSDDLSMRTLMMDEVAEYRGN